MTRFAPIALFLFALALHWPMDRAEFTFDDRDFVETNPLVTSWTGAITGFAHPFPPSQPERALYRPLTGLSYAADVARSGLSARAMHQTNALFYAALVVLIHALARALGTSPGAAVAVAALFAAHPVHCDAVDSISGRSEVLSLLLAVGALLAFLKRGRDPGARALSASNLLSAALYAGACLAKETGAVLPAVLLVHRVALTPRAAGRPALGAEAWRPLLPHLLVLVAYAGLRTAVLGRLSPAVTLLGDAPLLTRFWTMGSTFALDFQQLLFPSRLELDFYYQALVGIPTTATPLAILGWCAMAPLLAVAGHLAWRALRAPLPPHSAGVLCALALFLVPLFPTSHVLDIGALFAERFLFAPSLGFLLLLVIVMPPLLTRWVGAAPARVALGVACVLLVATGSVHSRARASEWRDAVRLWRAADEALDDKRIHTNLAAALLARGQHDLALRQVEEALALEPDYRPALGNRGVIQIQQGRLDEARATFERLAESDPRDPLAWFNLGNIALAEGETARAIGHFEHTLSLAPWYTPASEGLARARAAQGGSGAER